MSLNDPKTGDETTESSFSDSLSWKVAVLDAPVPGKLPQESRHIDWLFFSDCGVPEHLPENVRIESLSYGDCLAFVSLRLGIAFSPQNPYKLCDIKPALGHIHEDCLRGWDFWAFGDIDVIYGRLRDYFSAEGLGALP
jgi:hypothetical protein